MVTTWPTRALVIVAALVAMLAWGLHPAGAGEDGAGMWQYNDDWDIALVNLTDYDLTYLKTSEGAAPYPSCVTGTCGNDYYMLEVGTDWVVEPFRTKLWLTDRGGFLVDPNSYSGRLTLYSKGFPEWKFDLVYVSQTAHNLAEHGTWIGLSPNAAGQGWEPASTTYVTGYRWATPVDDKKMHNVTTLIGPKIMVALYGGNLNHFTVVVQQLWEGDGAGGTLWDDSKQDGSYYGFYLDFVDNCGNTVPQ